MQNLWLKRCNCGRTAVEFRSRKDLYVDSVKHLYCPKCVKETARGALIVDVKKWGSSTAKESDRGLYGILYNQEAIERRNKGQEWKEEDIINVFETGMVTPNLLSTMRDGIDFHILGIFKEGENIADYKKKPHKVEDADIKQGVDKEFDGKFYDTNIEEPLDRIAGKLDMKAENKVNIIANESVPVIESVVNDSDEVLGVKMEQTEADEPILSDSNKGTETKIDQTQEDNKSEILALGEEKDPVMYLEDNPFTSEIEEQPSSPIFPNKNNE